MPKFKRITTKLKKQEASPIGRSIKNNTDEAVQSASHIVSLKKREDNLEDKVKEQRSKIKSGNRLQRVSNRVRVANTEDKLQQVRMLKRREGSDLEKATKGIKNDLKKFSSPKYKLD